MMEIVIFIFLIVLIAGLLLNNLYNYYIKKARSETMVKYQFYKTLYAEDNIPAIEIEINNIKALFMIDTGAGTNVISKAGIELFKDKMADTNTLRKNISWEGIDEAREIIMPLQIKDRKHLQRFSYSNNSEKLIGHINKYYNEPPIIGLLGIPFLKDFNCLMDFDKGEIVLL